MHFIIIIIVLIIKIITALTCVFIDFYIHRNNLLPGSDLPGFIPLREDFDFEHENDAELLLADMVYIYIYICIYICIFIS
jgi:hypothetical protein